MVKNRTDPLGSLQEKHFMSGPLTTRDGNFAWPTLQLFWRRSSSRPMVDQVLTTSADGMHVQAKEHGLKL